MSLPPKDPTGVKDYRFTWADWLAAGETLADATIDVEAGLTLDVSSLDDGITSVLGWFSGGTAGEKYAVTCNVTTDNVPARLESRTVYIEVADL